MKIIIAGYGFVGKACASALEELHDIVIVDPAYNDVTIAQHNDADGIIVCVGTPSNEHAVCDDRAIVSVLSQVPIYMPILIKSTILPNQLNTIIESFEQHSICYSPEFLRAVTANQDFISQKYMILGGEDPENFWQELFTSVLTHCKLYFNCTITEAATVKYTVNSFLATKVAFFNQISAICSKNGSDYSIIKQLVGMDTRIGNSHMQVPGVDKRTGFGGHCLPKDSASFTAYAKNLNTPLSILDEVIKYNNQLRKNS